MASRALLNVYFVFASRFDAENEGYIYSTETSINIYRIPRCYISDDHSIHRLYILFTIEYKIL
jgi:hypothetical protein